MQDIIILPEKITNKIAAGEIIERPASVVKELIENAIDAKSDKIVININEGGKATIIVSDNGVGMKKKNAILSLKRYATNKIKSYKDILSTKTLGFRGEALPSISSISELSIITKNKNHKTGYKVISKGGTIKELKEAETSNGTMITVKKLFYNTPVRKKKLKSDTVEFSNIVKTITNISLANSKIKFKLIHNGKIIKNLLKSEKRINRIKEIIGENTKKKLLKIEKKSKKISIEGWISLPELTYPNAKKIHMFVNGRWVIKNKTIKNSIMSGYSERIKKGEYPICFIYINLPSKEVDINVHPSKKEIKFFNEEEVFKILSKVISLKLKLMDSLKWNFLSINQITTHEANIKLKRIENYERLKSKKIKIGRGKKTLQKKKIKEQKKLWNTQFFSNLIIIGQFSNSYILCESDKSIIIIDQHAAHERIIFEKLKLIKQKTKLKIEEFLLPEMVETGITEIKILEELIPHLTKQGIEIEIFGQNIFIIKSIPIFLDKKSISNLILSIIESVNIKEINTKIIDSINKRILLFACHNSIKSKQNLNKNQIKEIFKKLDRCENSSNCPHGRPIWIKIDSSFLIKKFGR